MDNISNTFNIAIVIAELYKDSGQYNYQKYYTVFDIVIYSIFSNNKFDVSYI